MRLLRLYLGDYRILRDLDMRFGPPGAEGANETQGVSYGLDFLVGVNSTGKSTILQALADLMRKLERHAPIPYAFELEYDLGPPDQKRQVKLSNLPDDFDAETPPPEAAVRLWVDGVATQLSGDVLPPLTVAFTTGSEAEWERIDQAAPSSAGDPSMIRELSAVEQALRELPGRPTRPDMRDNTPASEQSRFLLVRAWQLPLVTLCGLLTDMAEAVQPEQRRLRKVLDEARIGTIRGFSLKFRMHQEITSVADRETVRLLAQYATRALRLVYIRRSCYAIGPPMVYLGYETTSLYSTIDR